MPTLTSLPETSLAQCLPQLLRRSAGPVPLRPTKRRHGCHGTPRLSSWRVMTGPGLEPWNPHWQDPRNEINLSIDVDHWTALDTMKGVIQTVDHRVATVPMTWHNLATSCPFPANVACRPACIQRKMSSSLAGTKSSLNRGPVRQLGGSVVVQISNFASCMSPSICAISTDESPPEGRLGTVSGLSCTLQNLQPDSAMTFWILAWIGPRKPRCVRSGLALDAIPLPRMVDGASKPSSSKTHLLRP